MSRCGMKAGLPDVAQVRRLVRHDALSIGRTRRKLGRRETVLRETVHRETVCRSLLGKDVICGARPCCRRWPTSRRPTGRPRARELARAAGGPPAGAPLSLSSTRLRCTRPCTHPPTRGYVPVCPDGAPRLPACPVVSIHFANKFPETRQNVFCMNGSFNIRTRQGGTRVAGEWDTVHG